MPAPELQSLFVVSLPRSLSSLLYERARRAVGLAAPEWTSDGEILNRDRVPRRHRDHAPAGARFTLSHADPATFAEVSSFLSTAAQPRGHAYKDVVQPFVVAGWEALADFAVLKVRRDVAEVAYTMLKREWVYPARAASLFESPGWSLVEGLVRADAVIDALPGVSIHYARAVLDDEVLDEALRRLYPLAELDPAGYLDRHFERTRRRLERDRERSLVFRRIERMVEVVRSRLADDLPDAATARALS